MAQTGYTPILIYSSSTAAAAPAVGNLTNSTLGSELAINITDGKLFYKDNANAIQVIGWKTVPTSAGGTGLTSYTAGDLIYYASGTTFTKLGIGSAYQALQVNAGGTAPSWQPSASSVLTAQGDLLYASAANTLARLAKNTTASRYLSNTGTNNNPDWAQIDLTNGVTGTLPVANGGTGTATAFTAGSIVFAGASGVYSQNNANFFWDNSNTRLGILTATPTNTLSFGGNAARTVWMERHTTSNTAGNNLTIQSGGATSGATDKNGGNLVLSSGTSTGSGSSVVIFNTAAAGASGTTDRSPAEAGRITSAGAYILKGGLTTADGVGVAFPAIQSASTDANTLDDYEEGTWTPTLSAPGGTVTYIGQAGRYVKVGTQVTVSCYLIGYFSAGSGANNVTIGGLPFTTKNVTSPTALYHGSAFGLLEWIDWPADAKQFVVYANVNATTMVPNWSRDLAGSVVVTSNQWTNSSASLIFSMTYISE